MLIPPSVKLFGLFFVFFFAVELKRQYYTDIPVVIIKLLTLFQTVYHSEKGFSTYVYTDNKYGNQLRVESELWIQISRIDAM